MQFYSERKGGKLELFLFCFYLKKEKAHDDGALFLFTLN